jgi:hypothetical protein
MVDAMKAMMEIENFILKMEAFRLESKDESRYGGVCEK